MLEFVLRVVGMYFLAMLVIRLMGKRALGELGLFDFVIMTGVGHTLTSVALDRSLPFYEGIVVLFTLAALEYLMGFAALKSQRLSRFMSGIPVVVIDNGYILKENLAREKFNVDDLMQELRKHGVRDVSEVEKGILEPCGGFSVLLKESHEPVTRGELGISWEPGPYSIPTVEPLRRRKEVFKRLMPEVKTDEEETVVSIPQQHEILVDILKKLNHISARLERLEKT